MIAGKYRGRKLQGPPTTQVRPTSDRLRETLFNVLAPRIAGTRFLDLCAGSGAVGIEALSRGANHVTFVDRSRKMCSLIEANLNHCHIPAGETEVRQSEAAEFLRRRSTQRIGSWDLVFFDPPYESNYLSILRLVGSHSTDLLAEDALLIVEHHHKKLLEEKIGSIILGRTLKQGDSTLSFYQRANE